LLDFIDRVEPDSEGAVTATVENCAQEAHSDEKVRDHL
jgi:hypothetical protein